MMNEEITDEEFFDLLDDFAGPIPEMEWTMSDEEYERRHTAWWAAQSKERREKHPTEEEKRAAAKAKVMAFYTEENILNERSLWEDV